MSSRKPLWFHRLSWPPGALQFRERCSQLGGTFNPSPGLTPLLERECWVALHTVLLPGSLVRGLVREVFCHPQPGQQQASWPSLCCMTTENRCVDCTAQPAQPAMRRKVAVCGQLGSSKLVLECGHTLVLHSGPLCASWAFRKLCQSLSMRSVCFVQCACLASRVWKHSGPNRRHGCPHSMWDAALADQQHARPNLLPGKMPPQRWKAAHEEPVAPAEVPLAKPVMAMGPGPPQKRRKLRCRCPKRCYPERSAACSLQHQTLAATPPWHHGP